MARQKRNFWRGDKRFWSPIAITSGLAIFFFGVTYEANNAATVANNAAIGWVDIVFGIILMAVGFFTAPRKSER